jgi:hypothetical protein
MNGNLRRRFVCLVCAAALVLAAAAPALAAETDGLEAAIRLTKSLTDVPESMEEFNYYISENESTGYTIYMLNWSDGERGAISAEVANGKLRHLSRYDGNETERQGFGGVSADDARKAAEDFLAAVDPALAAKMSPTEDARNANTARHSFNFEMREGNIPVDFVSAQIGVDKHTGEIVEYSWQGVADPPVLPEGGGAVAEEKARAAFLAADGVRLEYRAWYDRESKEYTVKAVYALKDTFLAIDAETGEAINISGAIDFATGGRGMMQAEAAQDNAAPQLTAAELSALSALGELLTKEAARAAVARLFSEAQDRELTQAIVRKEYTDESRYMWNLSFTADTAGGDAKVSEAGAGARLDARTGEILSWHYYDYANRKAVPASKGAADKALEAARDFIEKNLSEKKRAHIAEDAEQTERSRTAEDPLYTYSFAFDRVENDIPFRGNGITVGVDARTGRITEYNCNWYENIDIPALSGKNGSADERDAAFDLYAARSDFGLKYTKVYDAAQKEDEILLVWHWNAASGVDYLIDADGFGVLGTDGKPYRESFAAGYGDIAGHWAESMILALIENGYYIEGADFGPNEAITQEAFLRYLYAPEQRYYDTTDAFYRMLADRGVVNADERDPSAALTRYDAAKFTAHYLGLRRVAAHPEVFVSSFKDDIKTEYRGYAAIVQALGIMRGDAAGRFNGARVLTKAEAAAVIFQILTDYAPGA